MLDEHRPDNPGIVIFRQGPVADLVRDKNGKPHWTVERPYPWTFSATSIDTSADPEQVVEAFGIRFGFAVLDLRRIKRVHFTVNGGSIELRVDA